MKKRVKVIVPASTSNLGAGFDVFGLALEFHNEIELEVLDKKFGLQIEIEGEGENSLPHDKRNLIWQAAAKAFSRVKFPASRFGFRMKAVNRIPLARGLGSSAAAALSGILAANAIAGGKLSHEEVLNLAVEFEGHPDNVAPQIYGGLCVSAVHKDKVMVVRLDPPRGLCAVACVPNFELSTKKARAALPAKVAHKDAVFNVSRASFFLASIFSEQYAHLKMAMEDRLHQPYRKKLVPGFDRVLERAYRAGALGAALSGAGPSIFSFASSKSAVQVAKEMEKGFAESGIAAKAFVLNFNVRGAETKVR